MFKCLVPQLVELFGKDQEVWPYWRRRVTGGWLALSFQSHSMSLCLMTVPQDLSSQPLLRRRAYLSTMIVIDLTPLKP